MSEKRKNPAAVSLGRKGGKASTAKLTPEQRKERARKAAEARWKEMSKPRIAYLDADGKLQPVRGVTPPGRKRPPEMVEFVFTPDETMADLLKSEMQSMLIELNGEEMPGRWSASSVTDNADGTISVTLERVKR